MPEDLYLRCYVKALYMMEHPLLFDNTITDIDHLAQILVRLELEKTKRDQVTDSLLDFDDEIESIECMQYEEEMMDITVSSDNLFYANDILTKNSAGIIHAADLMLALIRTEELDAMGKIMIKQLKNRYSDPGVMTRFLVGIDRSKMKLFDDDEARTLKPDAVAALKSYTPTVRKTETVASADDVIMNLPIAGKKPQLQGGDFVF